MISTARPTYGGAGDKPAQLAVQYSSTETKCNQKASCPQNCVNADRKAMHTAHLKKRKSPLRDNRIYNYANVEDAKIIKK